MIFSPNKFELYCCLLRNTIQHLIIKNGYKENYIKNLMKIHKAEAFTSLETEPINIEIFSSELLKAVFVKLLENDRFFHFKTNKTGNFLINKKQYTSLLLSLCKISSNITVNTHREKLLISSRCVDFKNLTGLIKKLNGIYFYERKSGILYVLISAPKTEKNSEQYEKDWEYILNPLSVVNIYLC